APPATPAAPPAAPAVRQTEAAPPLPPAIPVERRPVNLPRMETASLDPRPPARTPQGALAGDIGGGTLIPAASEAIALEVGKGTVIRLRQPAETVFVAESEVADVQVKSPGILYVYGKKAGETVLYVVDRQDRVIVSSRISVSHNLTGLQRAIARLMPDAQVDVSSIDGAIVLSGFVAAAQQAEDVRRLAQRFAPEQGGVINQIQVVAPNQVNLRVRIAEVSRTTLKELGFNTDALLTFGSFALGIATGNPVIAAGALLARNPSRVGQGTTNSIIGTFSGKNFDLATVIDALANEGIITMLAEPNLTALNGETASFLAGGEFPVPVAQENNTLTIEFKRFGVSLAFTPTLLARDRINLRVRPEVSELTSVGAIQVNGLSIPALSTRQAETTVELGSGQSFAIAGLLQNNTRQDADKTPVLADLPVLGPLFKSDRFRRNETELVIIVTPYVVRPVSAQRLAAPTDGLVAPNDVERIFKGQFFRQQVTPREEAPRGKDGETLVGPAGFILE
ncbi:MAG: type II and III secretion system protein family protein, partial [Alphaproteobacteria bacterium]|nr:type II and III secretion system protein family protein [Alphaproteobacteria bacterium]